MDTICVLAKVNQIGSTSMEIRLEVWARDLTEEFESRRHTAIEGVFKYVPIDAEGCPRLIPDKPCLPLEGLAI
jgi:acyl-CoA thioesterase YciA